jgi:hypothetical protein
LPKSERSPRRRASTAVVFAGAERPRVADVVEVVAKRTIAGAAIAGFEG